MSLEKIIIDISKVNKDDSIEEFLTKTSFNVSCSVADYMNTVSENKKKDIYPGIVSNAFLITDNRDAACFAIENGIGISVYLNGSNSASEFTEALYCIDSLKDMADTTLVRLYERSMNIPWTILQTDRCIVREMTVDDVDRLYEIYSDKETKQYIEDLYEKKEDEIQFTVDYINNQYRFFEYGIWIVINKKTNAVIGRAGLFNRENQDDIELGFVFAKEYWGMGYASEILTAVIKYAEEELEVTRLLAHVHHENIRSKRLLTKLGFSFVKETEVEDKMYDQYLYNIS